MRHRVYVVSAEYSAPLRLLVGIPPEAYHRPPTDSNEPGAYERVFFSAPPAGMSWADLGVPAAPTLIDLLASAAHRALGTFHELTGHASYAETCASFTDLLVTSMPLLGAMPVTVNTGLIPQMLREKLGLEFDCQCQFVSGTSDTGAGAFSTAVRLAQSRPSTILLAAGQIIPSGYPGQYRIRSVFVDDEQARGLDMMAMGDVLMDALRRANADDGFDRERCIEWLTQVRRRKLRASEAYPAALGMLGSLFDASAAEKLVTTYFRAGDVARSGCGAAAVVLTSDPAVLARMRQRLARGWTRHRNTPAVEVVGVGEGTTNPWVLARRTPLVSMTSIRQALASAADDADLPMSVFADSAFAVLHDAFPSMELAFLLAIGLDWQRATLRMTTWWSNPYGGLLAFGHAIGASGVVHVCKAFHVFSGDGRYVRPTSPVLRFRREGAFAFASSLGGPLSHVVVSILRGGIPPLAADQDAFFNEPTRPAPAASRRTRASTESRRRKQLRHATRAYVDRLGAHAPGLCLIEGATEIDVRSCAQALSPELVDALGLERLAGLVEPQALDTCRREVLALVHQLRADYLAAGDLLALRAARERYHQGLVTLVQAWAERGVMAPDHEVELLLSGRRSSGPVHVDASSAAPAADAEQPPAAAPMASSAARLRRWVRALKQCMRVPMLLIMDPAGPAGPAGPAAASRDPSASCREMLLVPTLDRVDEADFVRRSAPVPRTGPKVLDVLDDVLDLAATRTDDLRTDAALLPWWYQHARRPEGQPEDRNDGKIELSHLTDADQVFEALTAPRPLVDERQAELVFLRAYFAPFGPQAAVDLALRNLGVSPHVNDRARADQQVPAIFYKNDIIGSSRIADVHEAYELLGRAVQRARGWFGIYASTCAQHGDSVSLVTLDRRLDPGPGQNGDEAMHARREAISNASRFARDVAEWCLGYGIRLRTVVSFGNGVPYYDVNDDRSVASDSAIRGARLLAFVTAASRMLGYGEVPWIVFDWTEIADVKDAPEIFARELMATSGPGWRIPSGPTSPVALDRWDRVSFTVWYRAG